MFAKEIDSLKKDAHPVQKCMHGIIAREACLKTIADLQTQMIEMKAEQKEKKQEQVQETGKSKLPEENEELISPPHLNQFVEHLHALRMFSINIVECIHSWKEHCLFPYQQSELRGEEEPKLEFIYDGNNYLMKMMKDNAFLGIKSNPFLKYFYFSDRGDPFLQIPATQYYGVGKIKHKKKKKKEEKTTIPIE